MKIFLDDIRNPSDNTWTLVRSYDDFVSLISSTVYNVTDISFDHDLGLGLTGMDAAKWLVEKSLDNPAFASNLQSIHVHSANPVGAQNITGLFISARNHGIFNSELEITP